MPTVKPTGDGRPPAPNSRSCGSIPGPIPRNLDRRRGGKPPERPAADARYDVIAKDTRGFSITYRVKDSRGAEWNVKIGPEAQTEVVASRILWAARLPPGAVVLRGALDCRRARARSDAAAAPGSGRATCRWIGKGTWSWQRNPFVGTREYNGLLVGADADQQHRSEERQQRDLRARRAKRASRRGAGMSSRTWARRSARPAGSTRAAAISKGSNASRSSLGPKAGSRASPTAGGTRNCCRHIPIEHLKWACQRVLAITDRQWHDAFAAGNYDEESTARYVARIRPRRRKGWRCRDPAARHRASRCSLASGRSRRSLRPSLKSAARATRSTGGARAPRSAAAGHAVAARTAALRRRAPADCGRARRGCSRSGRGVAGRRHARRRSFRRRSSSPSSARWSCSWSAPASRARSASSVRPGSCATARRSKTRRTPA